MTTDARDLLKYARQLISGDSMTHHARSRAATLIARQASEEIAKDFIESKFGRVFQPSFNSLFIVVEQECQLDPRLHLAAKGLVWTWSSMSRACHAHAYPVEPTYAQVDAWIASIEEFVEISGLYLLESCPSLQVSVEGT
jgi:hypothetical protein